MRKIFIGTSPSGIKWFAYKESDVAKMTELLQKIWDKYTI